MVPEYTVPLPLCGGRFAPPMRRFIAIPSSRSIAIMRLYIDSLTTGFLPPSSPLPPHTAPNVNVKGNLPHDLHTATSKRLQWSPTAPAAPLRRPYHHPPSRSTVTASTPESISPS
jgi:hypothetical protein